MPAQSRLAPTRAPLLLQAEESRARTAASNAALAESAGLTGSAASEVAVGGDESGVAQATATGSGAKASANPAPAAPAAPGAPAGGEGGAAKSEAPPSGGLTSPTTKLQGGDLRGAAAELREIATTQRKLLSGGGDRALLQSSLAALAVTDTLVAAQQAKEAGNLADAARQAQTALGTLGRAPTITGTLREVLHASASSFGARTEAPKKEIEPQQKEAAAREGYDAALGRVLARASAGLSGGNPRARGRCYARVADAVDAVVGRFLAGEHAYMAASQLAARKDLFTETSASNLGGLPAGAIVVWGKGTSDSGHISVALGDGRESSDFVGAQMTRHYGGAGARVFLPKARMGR